MTEKNSEKAKIIFIEAKESLQFSNLNLEQLDQKFRVFPLFALFLLVA